MVQGVAQILSEGVNHCSTPARKSPLWTYWPAAYCVMLLPAQPSSGTRRNTCRTTTNVLLSSMAPPEAETTTVYRRTQARPIDGGEEWESLRMRPIVSKICRRPRAIRRRPCHQGTAGMTSATLTVFSPQPWLRDDCCP